MTPAAEVKPDAPGERPPGCLLCIVIGGLGTPMTIFGAILLLIRAHGAGFFALVDQGVMAPLEDMVAAREGPLPPSGGWIIAEHYHSDTYLLMMAAIAGAAAGGVSLSWVILRKGYVRPITFVSIFVLLPLMVVAFSWLR